ncbi:hypothetical protein B0H13DRAFT_1883163 [Mycena leptocephala]|nr:hypothetical protein B0H13DRAFT_1883163 [Mycena leptocephala]
MPYHRCQQYTLRWIYIQASIVEQAAKFSGRPDSVEVRAIVEASSILRLFGLAALLLTAVVASPVTHVTNLTAAIGNIVRIADASNFQLTVDPGYPQGPEFTPWILVPQDPSGTGSTFMIQSATFPDMFISYASFGAPATTPIHSQLVLRGSSNAAVFSLQTLAGGNTLNIMVPAIGKVTASWTSTLTDTTTPVTVATLQTGSVRMTFTISVIAQESVRNTSCPRHHTHSLPTGQNQLS